MRKRAHLAALTMIYGTRGASGCGDNECEPCQDGARARALPKTHAAGGLERIFRAMLRLSTHSAQVGTGRLCINVVMRL